MDGGEKGRVGQKRPDGRCKTKEELAAHHVHAKKLKLAEKAVRLQEQQVEEISGRNDIMLFTNGPGGADLEMARKFFSLKQKKALMKLRARLAVAGGEEATDMNNLYENVDNRKSWATP